MALNLFKLQKLKISVYSRRQRSAPPADTFTVMFNPASISMDHVNVFGKAQGMNTSGRPARYSHSRSSELKLDLVFDGTGVTDLGIARLTGRGSKSVAVQIDQFLKLCFYMDGKIHEPKFLRIQWGSGVLKSFDCRLQSVAIEYSSFDRDGAPLHATLKTVFVEDLQPAKRLRIEGKSSPDLSHTRVVQSGDTLPLLAREVYGSASYYLWLARVNKLDDFRDLTPGQEIIFPPLETPQ